MTAAAIVSQLEELGRDSYKKVLLNHSINEPVFGVKVEELIEDPETDQGLPTGTRSLCHGHLRRAVPGRVDCRRN
jgi:hypothetical protein